MQIGGAFIQNTMNTWNACLVCLCVWVRVSVLHLLFVNISTHVLHVFHVFIVFGMKAPLFAFVKQLYVANYSQLPLCLHIQCVYVFGSNEHHCIFIFVKNIYLCVTCVPCACCVWNKESPSFASFKQQYMANFPQLPLCLHVQCVYVFGSKDHYCTFIFVKNICLCVQCVYCVWNKWSIFQTTLYGKFSTTTPVFVVFMCLGERISTAFHFCEKYLPMCYMCSMRSLCLHLLKQ